ncbi:unnamed protein product [Rhizophagus irregularis]|nr:unnamed protein product [Rhizophagus irregularis]
MDEFVPRKSKYCPDCYKHSRISFGWCKDCETDFMKGRFPYWSSGNRDVDELIRHTQLNSSQTCDYLEWIPFEIKAHHKCIQSASFAEMFGITMDPTSNYMLVMKYYKSGNLYQYLDRSNGILSWRDIIDMLWGIAGGLERIHTEGKVLKNLHGGNLLIGDEEISIDTGDVYIDTYISDVGLYGPSYNPRSSDQIYGVLPYVAPEVLRGESYSTASDIYSFGIIMYTLATGERPWYNEAHDINLAKNICDGKRLEIPEDTPKFYVELIRKCWDNEPEKRPTATYLYKKLNWINLILDPFDDDYYISEEKRRKKISQLPKTYTHPEIHPEAYYTSRLLYFPEL